MPKDYVLFIHGTYTSSEDYADNLIRLIKRVTPIEPLVVFWGDVSALEEKKLNDEFQASHIWPKLWFRDVRQKQLLRFAGDAALYLSRSIGAKVVASVAEQVAKLEGCKEDDRLHLVTHSLGTVILFDILFSSRWDDEGTIGHNGVMTIRKMISGVDPNPEQGIRLKSITTMGSPLGIFSLIDVSPPQVDAKGGLSKASSTHDITPRLVKLLEYSRQELEECKLPWYNFVHPGDPIASPLEGVLPHLVGEDEKYIQFQDILVPANILDIFNGPMPEALFDLVADLFKYTPFSMVDSIVAHTSYWQSSRVARGIAQLIKG